MTDTPPTIPASVISVNGRLYRNSPLNNRGKPRKRLSPLVCATKDMPVMDRIALWTRKDEGSGCWVWTGRTRGSRGGEYGDLVIDGRRVAAHRAAYEAAVGPIPDGLVIDHLCRNRLCCNPEHLEPVTPRVNVLRGDTIVARNAAKTHCQRGHAFDEANTIRTPDNRRRCRECKRQADVARYRRRSQEAVS